MKSVITVERELRPCIVNGKKAFFHCWEDRSEIRNAVLKGTISGVVRGTFAIVEYEGGVVAECYPYEIKFIDNKFREYDFREGNKNDRA